MFEDQSLRVNVWGNGQDIAKEKESQNNKYSLDTLTAAASANINVLVNVEMLTAISCKHNDAKTDGC